MAARQPDTLSDVSLSKLKVELDNAEVIFSKAVNSLYFSFCDALTEIETLKSQIIKLQIENEMLKKANKGANDDNIDDIYMQLKKLRKEKIEFEKKLDEMINKVQEHYADDLK